MENVKVMKIESLEELEKVLKGIGKEITKDAMEHLKEEYMNNIHESALKDAKVSSRACGAVEKLINALDVEDRLRAGIYSLLLKNNVSKYEEKTLGESLSELTDSLALISVIMELFETDDMKDILYRLSSAAAVLSIQGEDAIEKAKELCMELEEKAKKKEEAKESKDKSIDALECLIQDIIKGA